MYSPVHSDSNSCKQSHKWSIIANLQQGRIAADKVLVHAVHCRHVRMGVGEGGGVG